MRLLIPTNSVDACCDHLVTLLDEAGVPFFRWNVDLWWHYEIEMSDRGSVICGPSGQGIDIGAADVLLLWRKPFMDLMSFEGGTISGPDQAHARVQMGRWLRACVAFMRSAGRVRLVEPHGDLRLPKLFQLTQARDLFQVPGYQFSVQAPPIRFGPRAAAKPLGDPQLGDRDVLYTTPVNLADLGRPYPWFVQELLEGGTDVTVVHILGRNHFYECEFPRGHGRIDWRTEINTPGQSPWHPLVMPSLDAVSERVTRLMSRFRLSYGRLDFIRMGDTLYFLECNTNGEFGWLDDPSTSHLHRRFAGAALDPSSVVV